MKIAVLVEPLNGKGFRATGGEPFCITAEGATREEALDKLKTDVEARLKAGAELITLDVGEEEPPWLKFAGMFKDNDPLIEEWIQAVADYRDQIDKDESRP